MSDKPTIPSRRQAARLAAVQALYQWQEGQDGPTEIIEQFLRVRTGETGEGGMRRDADRPLFKDVVEGTAARKDELQAHMDRKTGDYLRQGLSEAGFVVDLARTGVDLSAESAAIVVQILFATRTLGLSEQAVGLSYVALGAGTVLASLVGDRISRRIGPGPCLVLGIAVCGSGWLLVANVPAGPWGVAAFSLMLSLFGVGAVLIFINFLALRQAVTPPALLGRMTSTMRWLTLLAAAPGALLGGWLGEHVGLRASLAFAGGVSMLLVIVAWRLPLIRELRRLPEPERESEWLGLEADVRPTGL